MPLRFPSPTNEREITRPRCGSCQRLIAPGTSSVAFPAYHARCIDRTIALARAHHAAED